MSCFEETLLIGFVIFSFIVRFFFFWEAQNAKGNQDLVLHPFRPHVDAQIPRFSFTSHAAQRDEGRSSCNLLAAQSFPGDAAEEGMTLDVTHSSTSRAQAIAGVELEQLWSSIMESGYTVR